ncbi:NAD(P)/FAD-dependent oxidoreductase [Arsenicicoccus sp. oral taxon 190]|uniref:NAD(P)/FAD-dependent oxidoreductase n=1 Tax=Arsenicicoccus sp. oral taxon 190 TaxID=1658671 RepID=UPI00067A41ED|nr:amine oxidase [Arsenicicoccus sp. oral taxon 190]
MSGAERPGRDRRAVRIPAVAPDAGRARQAPADPHVVVVGGGIAGLNAAVCLAERGVRVTLLERDRQLGGRVASWPVQVAGDDDSSAMSRGFHAFFRQYYNLRALLRRIDPDLSILQPVRDYPLLHADGTRDSFTRIPRRPPWNALGFVALSPSCRLADLRRVDVERALALLDVDFPKTFVEHDGVSAQDVLDALHFPGPMRALALEVFARSFFADPREFSGGELVAMFHTYFLGSAEGLLFDVARDDFDTTLWAPLGRWLHERGVQVRCEAPVLRLDRDGPGDDIQVVLGDGGRMSADGVVLAVTRPSLQAIVDESGWVGTPDWRAAVARGRMAPRFVVQRLWLDRPVRDDTPAFLGTAALGFLDNLSAMHLLEVGAAAWARRTGGSVIELHAYAVPDAVTDAEVLADLQTQLHRLHPELVEARVLHEEVLVQQDCPLAGTDPWLDRPGVRTPVDQLVLAGDGIRCELPVALMERAATTGVQAANALLEQWGRAGHDVWSVPTSARWGPGVHLARRLAGRLDLLPGSTVRRRRPTQGARHHDHP